MVNLRELDFTNIALITDWINNSLPSRLSYDQWRTLHFENTTSPDGAPGVDAEGDGATNQFEFITDTNPLQGASVLRLDPVRNGGDPKFQFDLPANRSFRIEWTADFVTWQPYNAPGNDGLPFTPGPIQMTVSIQGDRQFHRVVFWEN